MIHFSDIFAAILLVNTRIVSLYRSRRTRKQDSHEHDVPRFSRTHSVEVQIHANTQGPSLTTDNTSENQARRVQWLAPRGRQGTSYRKITDILMYVLKCPQILRPAGGAEGEVHLTQVMFHIISNYMIDKTSPYHRMKPNCLISAGLHYKTFWRPPPVD